MPFSTLCQLPNLPYACAVSHRVPSASPNSFLQLDSMAAAQSNKFQFKDYLPEALKEFWLDSFTYPEVSWAFFYCMLVNHITKEVENIIMQRLLGTPSAFRSVTYNSL